MIAFSVSSDRLFFFCGSRDKVSTGIPLQSSDPSSLGDRRRRKLILKEIAFEGNCFLPFYYVNHRSFPINNMACRKYYVAACHGIGLIYPPTVTNVC